MIDRPGFIPSFPEQLPLLNISVAIAPFSKSAIKTFRLIERPNVGPLGMEMFTTCTSRFNKQDGPGHPGESVPDESIAIFYDYAISLLKRLCQLYGEKSVFTGNPDWQVAVQAPTVGEKIDKVLSLSDAVAALNGVVEQGAGMSERNISAGPAGGVLAHFARFEEIEQERTYQQNDTADSGPSGAHKPVDWAAVYQFLPNPKFEWLVFLMGRLDDVKY